VQLKLPVVMQQLTCHVYLNQAIWLDDNKGKQTVNDILKLYTIADEQKLFDNMP